MEKAVKNKRFFFLAIILLAGILAYSNSFHGPFLFDDISNIVERDGIHLDNFSSPQLAALGRTLSKKGRPLALASFALNYYFGGMDTFGYHLVNLIIHLLSSILVYLFWEFTLNLPKLRDEYGKPSQTIAFFAGLLFVTHPVQTQAVTYIVQRMASMSALFFILALYLYGKALSVEGKNRNIRLAACVLAGLLAMASKQNTVTLPLYIFLYKYYFLPEPKKERPKVKTAYLLAGAALFTIVVAGFYVKFAPIDFLNNAYKTRDFTPSQRMLTQLRVVVHYLSLLSFPLPSRFNLDYSFTLSNSLFDPATTFFSLIAILAMVGGSVALAKKKPLISFALIWFWGNLVLESSLLPLEMVYEHRLYLPSMGFFLLVSLLAVKGIAWLKIEDALKQRIKIGGTVFVIALLSIATYQRNKVWLDGVTLWKDVVSKSPRKARPHYNLGQAYQDEGKITEAVAQYRQALAIKPRYKQAHYNLGIIFEDKGNLTEAVARYRQALEIDPNYKKALYNLGHAHQEQGNSAKATALYKRLLKIDPQYMGVQSNLGNIYMEQGNITEAHLFFLEEIKAHPNHANAYHNLGRMYAQQDQLDKAAAHYRHALKLNPDIENTHSNLGVIYLRQRKLEQACSEFLEEVKRNPRNASGYYNLGNAYQEQGKHQKALAQYKTALEIDPEFKDAHNNLGSIYLRMGNADQAAREFLAEIKLQPSNPAPCYNLANTYTKQKRLPKAAAQYKRVLEIDPGFRNAHNQLGVVSLWQGRPEHALKEFLAEIKGHRDNDKAHKNLGLFYLKAGNREKAVVHFKETLSLNPGQPQAERIKELIKLQ